MNLKIYKDSLPKIIDEDFEIRQLKYRLVKVTQNKIVTYQIQECINVGFLFWNDFRWHLCSETIYSGAGETEVPLEFSDFDKANEKFNKIIESINPNQTIQVLKEF